MNYGIDVCSYQGRIDWKKVKGDGCAFAILKCIRKDLNPDTAFARNVEGCAAQKIPVDVYTYVYENNVAGAKKRAKAAVEACKAQGLEGCTIWWDTEDKSIRKSGAEYRSKLTKSILEARKIVTAEGYGFGVYCDGDFYTACLNANHIRGKWWIASYGPNRVTAFGTAPGRKKPVIAGELWGWQYCSRGQVRGISGSVDLDVAYGEGFVRPEPPDGNPYRESEKIVTSAAQAKKKHCTHFIASGEGVKWVQWELQRLGYDLGASGVDGKCGSKTVAAIEAFQRSAGLTVDGLCGPKTRAALKECTETPVGATLCPPGTKQNEQGSPLRKEEKTEKVNYRSRVAAKAREIYPLCEGKTHSGKGVRMVVSLSTLKAGKALSCNRMVSIVLQEAGLLSKGCIVAHTAKASGKKSIADAVTGYGRLKHCKLHWVNCLYKDLPEKWKRAGCVYFQNSNACISAGGGKIWSCNKSEGEKYKTQGDYLRTGGYPFTSKILVVAVPEG